VFALELALSSSLCWGVSDFLGGFEARRVPLLRVMIVSQGVGLVGLALLVVIRGRGMPGVTTLLPAAAAGVAEVGAMAAYYRALGLGTMSIVAPIAATGVVVPVVVGLALGDRPAPIQFVGIVAAIVGVALASKERAQGDGLDGTHRTMRTSVVLALVAALGLGAFSVGLRFGARSDVLWALVAARGAGVTTLVAYALVARPGKGPLLGRGSAPLLVIGALDLSANGLYALATRHGLLSIVSVGASLYPVVTVALARAVLHERVRGVQELGIAAALAGVVLIAAG
jgi:drug/metabolite transporter (DMT)-like permease